MIDTEKAVSKLFELDTNAWRTNNLTPASSSTRAPLASPQSYYRSKIYTATLGINPLIASASALFTLATKLRDSESYTDINGLYQQLIHEIRAFENNAQAHQYRSDIILVSRYILCSFLDETILHTSWGKISNWERHRLLVTFHNEANGGERFFIILDRLSEDVAVHIDLLELMYICLSFGFEGKYRHAEFGKLELDAVTEKLFESIRFLRGDLKKDFSKLQKSTVQSKATLKKAYIPIWVISTLVVVVVLTVYGGFNYLLAANASRLYSELQSAEQSATAPVAAVLD